MATLPDLYGVLGVPQDASEDDIKRAYRRLARELHPDVNGDPEAERRFKEIVAAYETLSDPARRRQYDLFGAQGFGQGLAGEGFPFGDFGDIFDVFFGGGVGGRRQRTRRPSRTRRGEDVFVRLDLSFQEAAFGVTRDVAIQGLETCARCSGTGCEPGTRPSRCRRCGGAGQIQDVSRSVFGTVMTARPCGACEGTGEEIVTPCEACRGLGRTPAERTVAVEIPGGVADGMDLRIAGQGEDGRAGAGAGDLYVSLQVEPHPIFERRGQDLVCELPVAMTTAALGAELEIPTLDGPETIRLEPGTQPGTVVRLRSRGLPHINRRGRGDLYVTVIVETPTAVSKEERQLLERLAEVRGERAAKGKGIAGKLRKLLET
jgi:molecular chaperone DnaJ